jgi:hypothetical protein
MLKRIVSGIAVALLLVGLQSCTASKPCPGVADAGTVETTSNC